MVEEMRYFKERQHWKGLKIFSDEKQINFYCITSGCVKLQERFPQRL